MVRAVMFAIVAAVALIVPTPMLVTGSTFRLAALEYAGHTGLKDSEAKMRVLYEGIQAVLEAQAKAGTPIDLLVTSETPTLVGSEDGFENMAQKIPGPRTERLAAIAKAHKVSLVAGLLETETLDGKARIYNAAIVIDRTGRLVAKYRKVRLPPQESTRDILPGAEPMVVDTEFGRMGLLICWEAQFPEYVEQLAALHPHFIVHPTWGNFEKLLPDLARKHKVFVASACWDGPSLIVDPQGRVLDRQLYEGAKPTEMKLAVAEIPTAPPPRPAAASQPTAAKPAHQPGT